MLDDLDRDLGRNPDHALDRDLDDLDRDLDLNRDLDYLDRNPDHNLDRDLDSDLDMYDTDSAQRLITADIKRSRY